MTRIVMKGLLVENEEHEKQLREHFLEFGWGEPKIIKAFKTKPGEGGPGGRSDVLIEVEDEAVMKMAAHPMHINGKFSWDDDYLANNREIIPEEVVMSFFQDVAEFPEELAKPKVKLIGEDGNVFAIIGRVKEALRRAGQKDKAKEFVERATSAESYNEVLVMLEEYVEVE